MLPSFQLPFSHHLLLGSSVRSSAGQISAWNVLVTFVMLSATAAASSTCSSSSYSFACCCSAMEFQFDKKVLCPTRIMNFYSLLNMIHIFWQKVSGNSFIAISKRAVYPIALGCQGNQHKQRDRQKRATSIANKYLNSQFIFDIIIAGTAIASAIAIGIGIGIAISKWGLLKHHQSFSFHFRPLDNPVHTNHSLHFSLSWLLLGLSAIFILPSTFFFLCAIKDIANLLPCVAFRWLCLLSCVCSFGRVCVCECVLVYECVCCAM